MQVFLKTWLRQTQVKCTFDTKQHRAGELSRQTCSERSHLSSDLVWINTTDSSRMTHTVEILETIEQGLINFSVRYFSFECTILSVLSLSVSACSGWGSEFLSFSYCYKLCFQRGSSRKYYRLYDFLKKTGIHLCILLKINKEILYKRTNQSL